MKSGLCALTSSAIPNGTKLATDFSRMQRMGLALVVLGYLGAVGCGQGSAGHQPVVQYITASPESAPQVLTSTDEASITKATTSYLEAHKGELKMRAPADELKTLHTFTDELSMTHVKLQQFERGVRVLGGEASVHYDPAGRLLALHQRYIPNLDLLDVTPTIDAAKAKTLVAANETVVTEPKLIVFAFDHEPTLAWEMDVKIDGRRSQVAITMDAHTGEIIDRMSRLQTIQGTGTSVFGTTRTFEVTETSGKFQMVDSSRPFAVVTFDAKEQANLNRAKVLVGASQTSWDTTASLGKGSGVDAHANAGLIVDFYFKKMGRSGWDGQGGQVTTAVHLADDQDGNPGWDNAAYDPSVNVLEFGDGRDLLKPTAAFMDVSAHEFTHAVTQFSSALRYENQSGALNESMSDIFGAFIEHESAPDETKNWLIGEGIILPGVQGATPALRDMTNPENGFDPQPGHMQEFVQTTEDEGGVHINSGIPNKACQLMTSGGTNTTSKITMPKGIGWDSAEKVWYRAQTTYLTETSDFAAAAQATKQAANDLNLAQTDQAIIDCAWKAVGVLTGDCAASAIQAVTPAPAASTTTGTAADDKSSDDDETPTTTTKKKKTTTAAPQAGGCSTSGMPTRGGEGWLFVLAAGAILTLRRRKRG